MTKFAQPISFKATYEQLDSIWPELEKMGYKKYCYNGALSSDKILFITNLGGVDMYLSDFHPDIYHILARPIHITEFNPELILAIAAMREGNEYYKGEYVYIKYTGLRCCGWNNGHAKIPVKITHWNEKGFSGIKNYESIIFDRLEKYVCFNNQIVFASDKSMDYIVRKAKLTEILDHFGYELKDKDVIKKSNNMKTERKIIGYKWKQGFEKYQAIVQRLVFVSLDPRLDSVFEPNSHVDDKLKEAGVRDIWFEPVYEEEKPAKRIMTMQCEGGTFELEVSKEGIYYAPDKTWLDIDGIKDVIKYRNVLVKFSNNTHIYTFVPVIIDAGCKKNTLVSEWIEVLKVYNEFQK